MTSPAAESHAPAHSDAAVRAATGRPWAAWRALIDAWPGHRQGHGAIVAHLQQAHGVDAWWAQAVAVGYERLSGRRRPHQQHDGSFAANISRTLPLDAPTLRARLLDDEARRALFPGLATQLRSHPGAKNLRLSIGPGSVEIELLALPRGRTRVTVLHARLLSPQDVAHWKAWWAAWLQAVHPAAAAEAAPDH